MRSAMSERLVATGAYRDLDRPVIVTSGEFLTPFYVNAEKLTGEPDMDAVLAEHGDHDDALIRWAVERAARDPVYNATLDRVASLVRTRLGRGGVVAGGQRRDWVFSGPVALRLGRPHVALYKQTGSGGPETDRIVWRTPSGGTGDLAALGGTRVVVVVDMLTAASSCHRVDPHTRRELGWVPMLRARGARVRDLVAVVSRRQGGEEALAAVGVKVRDCSRVDARFLERYSRNPADAVGAYRDPIRWTEQYLDRSGIEPLVGYLDDDPRKLPRLRSFLARYRSYLERRGLWQVLDAECRRRLGRGLDGLDP